MLQLVALARYAKLLQLTLMELHSRIVTLSSQVEFKGTYHYISAYKLYFYMFGVVLGFFEKGLTFFTPFYIIHTY